jgi:nicotinate phosphoribosyltransferase
VKSFLKTSSLALLTDLYELTMSYGYWKEGLQDKETVFHLFFRRPPFGGGFTIAAGLEELVHYLENFHFDSSDISYLETLVGSDGTPLFERKFLEYLLQMTFTCDVDAVPEGTVVFPHEPLLRIQGSIIQCQILESAILNHINFASLIATKSARICLAAKGDEVLEFGLRRAQGMDGAMTASRSAFIGGCSGTSNALAGKIYGIPVKGTHAHSWVMIFDDELESFEAYARSLPNNCVFLVDTYNTLEAVKKVIKVGKKLKESGKKLLGIRLDSGDLAYLSVECRKLLDEAGFHDTAIVASNELDETIISDLKSQGAQISIWGVGTNLVTARDNPALDGVYKLSAVRDPGGEWKYKLKLSEQMVKVSNPGILQVRRYSMDGENRADVLYDVPTGLSKTRTIIDPLDATRMKNLPHEMEYEDLLCPIFREGKRVYKLPELGEIREKVQDELARFHSGVKRFINPHQYVVGFDEAFYEMKIDLIKKVRSLNHNSKNEEPGKII